MNDRALLRIILYELKLIKQEAKHSKCNNLHYNNLISDLDNLIGKIKYFFIRSTIKERYSDGTLIENQKNEQDNNND